MPTTYLMVQYRRFVRDAEKHPSTLEVMCRTALDRPDDRNVRLWQRVDDRLLDLKDETQRQVLLSAPADLQTAVFGEMCLIHKQSLQAVLDLKAETVQLSDLTTAQIYELNDRQAPQGSQFVRGLAYWIAIGDHLFFIKTLGMTPDLISTYLRWLLRDPAAASDETFPFDLQSEFDRAELSGEVGDVRKLRVSGRSATPRHVMPENEAPTGRVVPTSRRVSAATEYVSGMAKKVADAVLGKQKADQLVESLGPDEYLSAETVLKIKGKRTEASRERIKKIVTDLADESDEKIEVEGKDGTFSGRDAILRVRMPFDLSHEGGNILDFDNVADQLTEVYRRFVRDKKIKA